MNPGNEVDRQPNREATATNRQRAAEEIFKMLEAKAAKSLAKKTESSPAVRNLSVIATETLVCIYQVL